MMIANHENEADGVQVETLLETSTAWDNTPYEAYPQGTPVLTVRRITIAAHGELAWHRHPMPNAAFVVYGEITVEDLDGKRRHFTAGQVIPETVNRWHRGVVGGSPGVFLVFYAGVKDMPLAVQKPSK